MQDVAGKLFGDRRLRPPQYLRHNHQQSLKCPRCDSLNTKFCYYNNYNLSQPRHYCKNCRRYWTNGGILRNVPIGGGCRKRSSKPKPKPKLKPEPINPRTPLLESGGGGGEVMTLGSNANNNNQEVFETASFGELYDYDDDLTVRIEDVLGSNWANNYQTVENGDQGLIDLTRAVDHHEVYWSQPTTSVVDYSNHWSHPMFLP